MKKQLMVHYIILLPVLVLNREMQKMNMILEDKKRFEKPELEVIEFTNDDIITKSGEFGNPDEDEGDINS